MESNSFDYNNNYFYTNQPTPEQIAEKKAEQVQDSIEKLNPVAQPENAVYKQEVQQAPVNPSDSLAYAQSQNQLGAFAYSAGLASATDHETVIENDLVKITVSNKGGQITEVLLKNYKTYNMLPLYVIKDQNASLNLSFATQDNRNLQTKDLYFEPNVSSNGDNQVLSMRLNVAANRYLEYRYELKPDDYMLDFAIRTQGMETAINTSQAINLDWQLKSFRTEKSVKYENRYTRLTYNHDGGKISKLSEASETDEETEEDIKWLSYRQHFFSTI